MEELEEILYHLKMSTLSEYRAELTYNEQLHKLILSINNVLTNVEEGREFTKDELAKNMITRLALSGCLSTYELNKDKNTHIKQ